MKGLNQRRYEVLHYIRENYNLQEIKCSMFDECSQKVILPDETEKIITYDFKKDEVVEIDIGKPPILRCKGCGKIFKEAGFFYCDCKEDRVYVDIERMYLYVRHMVSEKIEVIREPKNAQKKIE